MVTSVPALSYAATAVAFFALFVLLVTRWRLQAGILLVSACFTTSLWAIAGALHPAALGKRAALPAFLELLRNAAWILFLFDLVQARRLPRRLLQAKAGQRRKALHRRSAVCAESSRRTGRNRCQDRVNQLTGQVRFRRTVIWRKECSRRTKPLREGHK